MSKKEVDQSKLRFIPAKKPAPPKDRMVYLDGKDIKNRIENSNSTIEIHYKEKGEKTTDSESSYCMERRLPNNVVDYFVKFATAGPGVGRILNPWGTYYSEGDDIKFEKTMGRKRYEFRKVNKEVFNLYLQFLRTRNQRHILAAERESINVQS